jgi:hypothetical protein
MTASALPTDTMDKTKWASDTCDRPTIRRPAHASLAAGIDGGRDGVAGRGINQGCPVARLTVKAQILLWPDIQPA